MELTNRSIKCSAFQETEAIIKKAETKIKEAKGTKERQYYAQDILLEADTLLACASYNSNNPDCKSCRLLLLNYIQEYKHLAKDKKKKSLLNWEEICLRKIINR